MSCPTCKARMLGQPTANPTIITTFWCPNCGTLLIDNQPNKPPKVHVPTKAAPPKEPT